MEHLGKKVSLTHFICSPLPRISTICSLASANVFKERCPGLTKCLLCWQWMLKPFFKSLVGDTFFFPRVKNKVSKNTYASYGLLRCQHFSSPRPPTWHGRGLSSGCSKSQELQKAKLNKLENWNSKVTRLSVPSPFPSVLAQNRLWRKSPVPSPALAPPSCITLRNLSSSLNLSFSILKWK